MSAKRPQYEAQDGQGMPFTRLAAVVGELDTPEARSAALEAATHAISALLNLSAQRRIGFGTPVHVAFGLTRQQAKNHAAATLLLTTGDSLSLDHCPQYN